MSRDILSGDYGRSIQLNNHEGNGHRYLPRVQIQPPTVTNGMTTFEHTIQSVDISVDMKRREYRFDCRFPENINDAVNQMMNECGVSIERDLIHTVPMDDISAIKEAEIYDHFKAIANDNVWPLFWYGVVNAPYYRCDEELIKSYTRDTAKETILHFRDMLSISKKQWSQLYEYSHGYLYKYWELPQHAREMNWPKRLVIGNKNNFEHNMAACYNKYLWMREPAIQQWLRDWLITEGHQTTVGGSVFFLLFSDLNDLIEHQHTGHWVFNQIQSVPPHISDLRNFIETGHMLMENPLFIGQSNMHAAQDFADAPDWSVCTTVGQSEMQGTSPTQLADPLPLPERFVREYLQRVPERPRFIESFANTPMTNAVDDRGDNVHPSWDRMREYLARYNDELAEHRKRQKPTDTTPYECLTKVPQEIIHKKQKAVLLDNDVALFNEGEKMRHCIYNSYKNDVKSGEYIVYHITGPGCNRSGLTCGIKKIKPHKKARIDYDPLTSSVHRMSWETEHETKWIHDQTRGKANSTPDMDKIQGIVDKIVSNLNLHLLDNCDSLSTTAMKERSA